MVLYLMIYVTPLGWLRNRFPTLDMERKQCNLLQNFDEPRSEILKKRLLKTVNISAAAANLAQNSSQQNVLLNTIRVS